MNRSPFAATPTPIPDTPSPPTGLLATEPTITIAAVTSAVAVLIALGASFGLSLTDDQRNSVLTAVGILWPIATTAWIRRTVWAPHTVQRVVNDAAVAGAIGAEPPKVTA